MTARIAQIQSFAARPAVGAPSGASFASHLAAASDASGGSARAASVTATPPAEALARPPALAAPPARRSGPPAELAAFGNGRIPASALTPIGRGNHRLWAPAAAGFQRLEAAAAQDGVTIGVTDSYRSYDQQVDLAKRKGLYSQGGLAATPGTSNHGWGASLDLDLDSRALEWMRANASRFGFVEDVPREPWHWTYTPNS